MMRHALHGCTDNFAVTAFLKEYNQSGVRRSQFTLQGHSKRLTEVLSGLAVPHLRKIFDNGDVCQRLAAVFAPQDFRSGLVIGCCEVDRRFVVCCATIYLDIAAQVCWVPGSTVIEVRLTGILGLAAAVRKTCAIPGRSVRYSSIVPSTISWGVYGEGRSSTRS